MGLCGTVHIWILGFSELAKPITRLWKKNVLFHCGNVQNEAFETLKDYVSSALAICSIDYTSENPVILSVDSSFMVIRNNTLSN